MNSGFYIAIAILLSVLIFWITLIFKFSKKNKLSDENIKLFLKHFKQINLKLSPKEQIIDYDKLYHKVLLGLWYKWTFWEILKQYPNEINDIQKIWELHKLRNKLVHDFDLLTEKVLKRKSREYKNLLTEIIK